MIPADIFNNYRKNQEIIAICNREIAIRRLNHLPSMVSQLTLAPAKPSGNSDSTARTAIKIMEDTSIDYWKEKKDQAQADIDLVDELIELMDKDEKKVFELRYKYNYKIKEIASIMDYSIRTIQRKLGSTLDRFNIYPDTM